MRTKKMLLLGIVLLGIGGATGCGFKEKNSDEKIIQYIEDARKQGDHEVCIDILVETSKIINADVIGEHYDDYLEAKERYEENKTLENFERLRNITELVYGEIKFLAQKNCN